MVIKKNKLLKKGYKIDYCACILAHDSLDSFVSWCDSTTTTARKRHMRKMLHDFCVSRFDLHSYVVPDFEAADSLEKFELQFNARRHYLKAKAKQDEYTLEELIRIAKTPWIVRS